MHQKITPRIGGIVIVILFLLFMFVWHFEEPIDNYHLTPQFFNAIMFGTVGIMLIGLLDDIVLFTVKNRTKFIVEVLIALIIIYISGIKLDAIHLADRVFNLGFLSWPVTVLWLVGIANALNIIDGVDGLAGTVSLVSFFAIGILAYLAGDHGIVIFCALCAGLAFGFLGHNLSPARIFLGDTGSLFFGIILGLLCIYLISTISRPYGVIIAPLILGFPLLDVGLAMLRRFFKGIAEGESIFRSVQKTMIADNDHIHHRLIFRGLRHSQTTFVIAIYSITTCAVAVVIGIVHGPSTIIFITHLALITGWLIYKLGFFDKVVNFIPVQHNRNSEPRADIGKKINVIVLNATEYQKHALEFYQQKVFSLRFMEKVGNIDDSNHCAEISAVLVNSTRADLQSEELNQAIQLSYRFKCPMIVIADGPSVNGWERTTQKLGIKTLLVHKPVYIPKLFNDLYLIAVKKDSFSKYKGMMGTESSASPLVERK